jgi:hypothetical protein
MVTSSPSGNIFCLIPAKQQIGVAAGQIPPANAAGEENVAANQQLIFAREKTKTPRTVARNFQHFEFEAEKVPGRHFFDKDIRLSWFDLQLEAKAPKKFAVGNHRSSFGMTANLATKALFNLGNVLDVINMSVGEEQQFEIDPTRINPVASAIGRIEQNPPLGRVNQVTVRLENAAAKGFVSHERGSGCGRH